MNNGIAPSDEKLAALYDANPEILYAVMTKARMPSARKTKPKVFWGFPPTSF